MTSLAWMRPKLAELCGVEHWTKDDCCYFSTRVSIDLHVEEWHPDEDVAQALRCLEALCYRSQIDYDPSSESRAWGVSIFQAEDISPFSAGSSLSSAICHAIAAAMEWEEPQPGSPPPTYAPG